MRIVIVLLCGFIASLCGLALAHASPPPPPSPTPSPDPSPEPAPRPVEVMILGVSHFAGSSDAVQAESQDILGDVAQAQIQQVTQALERFKPDRILVEYPASKQADLDVMYQDYLAGRRAESKNEIDQLGFRLAKRLGHEQVLAFDHPSNMDFPSLMKCAQETGRPELIARFQNRLGAITKWINDLQANATIGESLAVLNDPRYDDGGQRLYMDLLEFDTADRQPALAILTTWYARNLKMHATMRRAVNPGEHILVLVGAGHAKHLRDFVRQESSMELVDPIPFLPKPPARFIEELLAIEAGVR